MKITLTRAQRQLSKACATDETRPVLTCMVVGNGWCAGADGFMLARMEHDYKGDNVLFPAKFLALFNKCGDVTFTVGPKRITGNTGHYDASVLRVDGTYPNHQKIFDDLETLNAGDHVAFNEKLMRRALDCFYKPDYGIVRMWLKGPSDALYLRASVDFSDEDDEDVLAEALIMPMFVQW